MIKNISNNRYTTVKAKNNFNLSTLEDSFMDYIVKTQEIVLDDNFKDELNLHIWGKSTNRNYPYKGFPLQIVECIKPAAPIKLSKSDIFYLPEKIKLWIGKDDNLVYKTTQETEYESLSDEWPNGLPLIFRRMNVVATQHHKAIEINPNFDKNYFEFTPSSLDTLVNRYEDLFDY